jgi:hypothetical protein
MFSILCHDNWELTADDNKILFCAHMQKTLTMLSLTAGNVSSILCSTSLGIPVARECRQFHSLETSLITHVRNEFTYKNPSDIAILLLTSVLVCKWEQLPKSASKHSNYCVETHWCGFFGSRTRNFEAWCLSIMESDTVTYLQSTKVA